MAVPLYLFIRWYKGCFNQIIISSIVKYVGKGVVRVCESLRTIRGEADAALVFDDASLIQCTILRKYIATVTQVFILISF